MKKEEFAELFFEEAKKEGREFTSQGNIKCPNGKNISKKKLEDLFEKEKENCINIDSNKLQSYKIESCCSEIFKEISKKIIK